MMTKLNFQQPLLRSVSRDLSNILQVCWFGAQETFLMLLSMLKTVVLLIFVETMIFFRILWWILINFMIILKVFTFFTGTLYIHTFWQILLPKQLTLHSMYIFCQFIFLSFLNRNHSNTLMLLAPYSTVLATAFPLSPGLFTVIAHGLFLFDFILLFLFCFFIYLPFSVQLLWNLNKMLHK